MKAKVHKLINQVQFYETLDFKAKKQSLNLILEITDMLQDEVQNCTKKIINR